MVRIAGKNERIDPESTLTKSDLHCELTRRNYHKRRVVMGALLRKENVQNLECTLQIAVSYRPKRYFAFSGSRTTPCTR